jgi:hypothetical protein
VAAAELVRIERRLEELVLTTAAHAGAWEPVGRGGASAGVRESVQYVNHAAAALAEAFLESAARIIGRENEFYAGLASLAGALGVSRTTAGNQVSTLAGLFERIGHTLPDTAITVEEERMLPGIS